jgi:HEAT repeat protein
MIEERAKELERASRTDPSVLNREELLALMGDGPWSARMHVCRMLPRLGWPADEYKLIRAFLFEQVADSNTFVRAWALDALASFACTDPSIRSKVLKMIEEALSAGPPSIRVRAREGLRRLLDCGGVTE